MRSGRTTRALCVLAALALAGPCPSQDSRAETGPSDPGSALIDAIDARLYSAEREGLSSVAFHYQARASGPLETPAFRVDVTWKKGKREVVEFRKPDGGVFEELPYILRQPASAAGAQSARETFETGARGIVATFRGIPYSQQFGSWRKRLEARTVNGREERTIVCEPVKAGVFRRVEIALDRKDLPWRLTYFLTQAENGVDRLVDEPVFTNFDGKLLVTSFKKTRGTLSEQVVVNYQRKGGFIVPSSYERLAPGQAAVRFVFEDIRVDP